MAGSSVGSDATLPNIKNVYMSQLNNSLLCPSCRKLISKSVGSCPYCGLSRPGSRLKNNFLTRSVEDDIGCIRFIIIASVLMFVVSLLIDMTTATFSGHPMRFLSPSGRSLLVLGSTGVYPLFQLDRWWTLISATYLHGGLLHIVFNMIALYQLGPLAVREYGAKRTIAIYTIGGAAGYLLSAFAGVRLTIGGSAAVCALIGAMLYYGKNRGGNYGTAVFSQIGGWAVGIALFGFMIPGINNWGHGGGMAAGFLLGALLGYREKSPDRFGHRVLALLCYGVTGLVLVWSCFNGLLFVLAGLGG